MNTPSLIAAVGQLLGEAETVWNEATVQVAVLVPDGSSRRFFQLRGPGREPFIAILPPENDARGQAEATAFYQIGRHLRGCGAPIPEIHAFDPATGLVLCEDLGDRRLYEEVVEGPGAAQTLGMYEQTVRQLARMQVRAAEGFDPAWCWDTPRYDRTLMQERESGYFLKACCRDLLQLTFDQEAVEAECAQLATEAVKAPADFFLHRDFQCRNLMVQHNAVRFIDFQGGRLGPLAYDLASLLLDPYAALPLSVQDHLTAVYLEALQQEIPYNPDQFRHEYIFLALQRNLQILGAFAFLSQVRQKPFFAQFIRPALVSLSGLLAKSEAAEYVGLRNLTSQSRQELEKRS
jgi:aminoglycoside/choline kinase family phosphotransferase